MLECKICGTKFNAVIERHYLARDNGKNWDGSCLWLYC